MRTPFRLFLLLLAATAAAYYPAWHGGLLWDDDAHLTADALRSASGLWRIWFDVGATQQYYPLVHSAFWAFYQFWGLDTLGYHLANIALHATSACLFFVVLTRLRVPGALVAAAVFALHPVHVESVAWMTELKNTLSTAAYLAAALAYLRYDVSRSQRWYAVSLILFVAALLSKTVTASLPAALLVIFWWQRGRITRKDVMPLLPFFALGLAAGLFTAWFERTILAAQGAEYALSATERFLLAGRAVWFYFAKLVWPANLAFIYPRWQIDSGSLVAWLYSLGALAALAVAWASRGRTRAPLAALLLFGGTLFPALGFFNVYPFRYSFVADHFQYLASLPMIAALSAALVLAIRRVPEGVLALVLAVPLAVLTSYQSRDYRSSDALFRATLARNPDCWLCYNNLASTLVHGNDQELGEAVTFLTRALALNPQSAEAHNNMGGALQRQGRFEEALREHDAAARLNPRLADARYNVGVVQAALGRTAEARAAYEAVVREWPTFVAARGNLGMLLLAEGRVDEALVHLKEAVRIDPTSAAIHDALATAYLQRNDLPGTVQHLREAARLAPSAQMHYRLALVLATSGRLDDAIAEFQRAAALEPANPELHHDLGAALANAGRLDEAMASLETAIQLRPDYKEAHDNLARIRAFIKDRR